MGAGPEAKTYMNGDPPRNLARVGAGRGLKTYMKAPFSQSVQSVSSVSQFSQLIGETQLPGFAREKPQPDILYT